MSELAFTIIDARVEPYAVIPTLLFRLQITEGRGSGSTRLRCAARSKWSHGSAAIRIMKKICLSSFSVRRIAGVVRLDHFCGRKRR